MHRICSGSRCSCTTRTLPLLLPSSIFSTYCSAISAPRFCTFLVDLPPIHTKTAFLLSLPLSMMATTLLPPPLLLAPPLLAPPVVSYRSRTAHVGKRCVTMLRPVSTTKKRRGGANHHCLLSSSSGDVTQSLFAPPRLAQKSPSPLPSVAVVVVVVVADAAVQVEALGDRHRHVLDGAELAAIVQVLVLESQDVPLRAPPDLDGRQKRGEQLGAAAEHAERRRRHGERPQQPRAHVEANRVVVAGGRIEARLAQHAVAVVAEAPVLDEVPQAGVDGGHDDRDDPQHRVRRRVLVDRAQHTERAHPERA
mmetsp:Transcript_39417/g.96499  ORF Transcript_39417/g.96499 Transcript_39417/m.96499 type:complete len:308 (+) Transcript_39417:439-1362(+)